MPGHDTPRVLVVGASGRVGRMLIPHWQQLPDADDIVPQYRSKQDLDYFHWDPLEGPGPLQDEATRGGSFDAMVVLAGATPGEGQPMELNRLLAEACLNAAERAGISRVLLASSSAVYGLGDGRPFSEDTPRKPVNAYGQAKLDMERACRPWRETGIDLCILRIGNVAGADAVLINVAKAAAGDPIKVDVFEDNRGPLRSYIGPGTLAEVLQSLVRAKGTLPAVLNVAAPLPIHMETLVEAAAHPWQKRDVAGQPHQHVTLNCARLCGLHSFRSNDSSPEEMVRQWKEAVGE